MKSPAFENNKSIPSKYTCNYEDVSPPLTIEGIPEKTKSLALIVEDLDAPARLWVHWLVWNIPPIAEIQENSVPGTEGLNTDKKKLIMDLARLGEAIDTYLKSTLLISV